MADIIEKSCRSVIPTPKVKRKALFWKLYLNGAEIVIPFVEILSVCSSSLQLLCNKAALFHAIFI